jgi:hypothetical protein
MSTATLQKKTPVNPPEKLENGVPAAARPAPVPTPAVDDEELRKEAAAVEQEEEAAAASVQTNKAAEDVVSSRLLGAAKEITDEIEECDKVIAQAEADCKAKHDAIDNEHVNLVEKTKTRREELTSQFQNAINRMQAQYGVSPKQIRKTTKQPKTRKTRQTGKPIRVLILDYLEKHRSARTSEIRTYLQAQGRTTNPGVELSRMVKDKSIINKERGMYTLGKSK